MLKVFASLGLAFYRSPEKKPPSKANSKLQQPFHFDKMKFILALLFASTALAAAIPVTSVENSVRGESPQGHTLISELILSKHRAPTPMPLILRP